MKRNTDSGSGLTVFAARLTNALTIIMAAVMLILLIVNRASGGVTKLLNSPLCRVYLVLTCMFAMIACVLNLSCLTKLRVLRHYEKLKNRKQ